MKWVQECIKVRKEVIAMNEENIDKYKFNKRTPEEQREIARLGGIKSGEVRREKKAMKEQIELLLSLPLKDEKAKKQLESLGIDTDNIDNQMAMVISMWQRAIKGDVQAFNTLRDTVGEKPTDKVEHSGSIPVVIDDDIKE